MPYLTPWAGRKVLVLDYAISDVDADIELAALPDKIDTGQLVTPGTHGMEWSPDVPEAVARTVTARTVDSLVLRGEVAPPDFMKIDVEGHEMRVLTGARQTIDAYLPAMLIEFHTPELHRQCRELLRADYAYRVVETVRHPHYPPNSRMWFTHGWLRAFPR
jgi:FkbM family methyltransferase